MIVYKPVEVTSANLISTTLFDVAPGAFNAGTTYAVDQYVSVAGALGAVLIYKSLQAGNLNNPPASSPTFWAYSSTIYGNFVQGSGYDLGAVVYDPTTKCNFQSIAENNNGVLDPIGSPPWLNIGVNASILPGTFNAGTTYALGDYVYVTLSSLGGTFGQPDTLLKHFVYKSLQAGNLNNTPSILGPTAYWEAQIDFPVPWNKDVNYSAGRVVYTPDGKLWKTTIGCRGVTPVEPYKVTWVNIGTANKWAAFDAESSSQSKASGSLVFTVAPGVVDAVALLNAEADLVQVVVRDGLGGAVIYDQSSGVLGNLITDWWEYFHSDLFIDRRQILFNDLPLSANAHITVTLTGTNIALGDCVFSRGRELGLTAFGLQVGIRDFSVVTEDGFGGQKFNKRRNRKTMKSREWIPRNTFNRTFTVLSDLPATPCVWVAGDIGDLNEALMIKAWYKDFTTEIAGPYELYTSLELEGLT